MRKWKIIAFAALAILLCSAAVYFLSRDSGPPVQVIGDFSAKDAAQIKRVARRRLWHDAFPSFSLQNIKALPGGAKRVWTTHVDSIFDATNHQAYVWLAGPGLVSRRIFSKAYVLTNGPEGWAWESNYFYIIPR